MNKCTVLNLTILFTMQSILNALIFAYWPEGFHILQNIGIFLVQVGANVVPWAILTSLREDVSLEFPIANWENK
jgi:hypothetical protein